MNLVRRFTYSIFLISPNKQGETRKQLQKKESQVGEKLTNYGSFADNLEQSAQNASSKDDDEFNSSEHMKTEIQKLLEEASRCARAGVTGTTT
jgi:hypothetical protein